MTNENSKLDELNERLDKLLAMHNDVSFEIDNLRVEILKLKVEAQKRNVMPEETSSTEELEISVATDPIEETIKAESRIEIEDAFEPKEAPVKEANLNDTVLAESVEPKKTISSKKFDLEKLIGENLINKVGILILIIGVAIGAKYSIENDLISPLTRIVLGYLTGTILLVLALYLKKNYLNFSAVILSGAMAIFYFITFFAYDFYQLLGQEIAFGLMVIFTIFTVLAALNYDKEIIAHLGLVGAISVPFLLSNESGNVTFLFTYLALINLAIAFISLRKNWKILFYSAFALTWAVFFTWMAFEYDSEHHFTTAFGFLFRFEFIFGDESPEFCSDFGLFLLDVARQPSNGSGKNSDLLYLDSFLFRFWALVPK